MQNVKRGLVATCAMVSMLAAPAYGQSTAEAGRAILEAHKDAVITLQLVVNVKASFPGMGSRESEEQVEATGVIIHPSGLGVASLTEVDPTIFFQAMGGGGIGEGSFESDVADAKYLFESGDEVDVEIVLRDPDLDLAFFRPVEKAESEFTYLKLDDPGEPQLLDEMIVVNRLGRVANRVYSLSIEFVEAIMERPRLFYIPGKQDTRTGLGCPAFTTDGKIIGFTHLRTVKATGGGGSFGGQENMTSVILPAADVADLIPNAMESEGEEPAEEEPAEEEEAAEDGAA